MLPATSFISNLTPLRGITALLVAVYHFEDLLIRFVPQGWTMFFSKCYLMVDVFFIMSGFIITHVYQKSFQEELKLSRFWKFTTARFARIYPLHFLMLLVIVVSYVASGSPPDAIQNPKAIPTNLFLIHSFGIHNTFTWNVPSWSISAEWWCYMLFPILIQSVGRWKSVGMTVLFFFSVLGYLSIMYWLPRVDATGASIAILPQDLNVTFDYGFLRGLSGFVLGLLVYKLYEVPRARKLFDNDAIFCLLVFLAVTCLHLALPDILSIPLFAAIVMSAACNSGRIFRMFEMPFLQLVGDVSYSIYMLHVVVLFSVMELLSGFGIVVRRMPDGTGPFWIGLLGCIAFLALIVYLSTWSYRKIEKPSRDFINRKLVPAISP